MHSRTRRLGLIFVAVAALFVAGCGSSTPAKVNGASLDGNWNVVGRGQLGQRGPALSFSLIEEAGQLYARGQVTVACSGGGGGGGGLELTGVLASDGSFTLTQSSGSGFTLNGDEVTVVVTGALASGGASAWSGTYSMTTPAGSTECLVNETGPFTAAAIGPLSGTYAGALAQANTGAAGVSASVTIAQGVSAYYTVQGTDYYYLPLTGTIDVTGIPCFSHGTIAQPPDGSGLVPAVSLVEGDQLLMFFNMDDGSQLQLLGNLNGASVSSIALIFFLPGPSSQCPSGYSGTLSQQ